MTKKDMEKLAMRVTELENGTKDKSRTLISQLKGRITKLEKRVKKLEKSEN